IAFSSRKEPFLVTVFAIGGGGWVTIGLGLDGFEAFDIGLEFGASVALDLGVASGEVHIFIGIYFSMQPKEIDVGGGKTKTVTETKLEAYLRFGGSLEVLGIVTLSVELYIGFTYVFPNKTPAGNKLIGRATLVMEVSVLGFSETVSVEVKREIDGPASADSLRSGRAAASLVSGDRSFGQQISASDWSTYCNAFASGA
ncbi:MAG TPA: hypothetical protein PLV93_12620, partial [Microthrixaceae bacterium]|nr:hypothetical protein [Microthrixaceae bacterium]